jgi:hypothetical protein
MLVYMFRQEHENKPQTSNQSLSLNSSLLLTKLKTLTLFLSLIRFLWSQESEVQPPGNPRSLAALLPSSQQQPP